MDDIIIRGGLVVDGSGEPGFRADVAVKDGRIRAIGDLSGEKAARELDASGLVVAPGFLTPIVIPTPPSCWTAAARPSSIRA